MFLIKDGRDQFYQWDIDRYITVADETVNEIHFCNGLDSCSLVVEVVDGLAPVPNVILQNDFPIKVYAYCNDGYTKVEKIFKVKARSKPADYVYTETEIKTYSTLDKRIGALEAGAISKEYVDNALGALVIPTEEDINELISIALGGIENGAY